MANITVGYDVAGNALDYTTLAAAFTAAASEDNLQIWYSDANRNHQWGEYISGNGVSIKGVSIEGMLSKRRVIFVHQYRFYYLSGNLSGVSTQLVWQNFTLVAPIQGVAYDELGWNDSSAAGAGVLIKNVVVIGASYGVRFHASANDVCQIQNCIFLGCRLGVYITQFSTRYNVFNCTFVQCQYPVYLAVNVWIRLKNCVIFGSNAAIGGLSGAGYVVDYCVTWNADADTFGTNGYINQEFPDMGFLWNNSNDEYPQDFRVTTSAWLKGKGTDVGLTEDIDGNDYTGGPYPIGASDGISLGAGGGGGGPVGMGVLG